MFRDGACVLSQDMSDSVNVMFKDQNDKRRYRRDEDRLFNQVQLELLLRLLFFVLVLLLLLSESSTANTKHDCYFV